MRPTMTTGQKWRTRKWLKGAKEVLLAAGAEIGVDEMEVEVEDDVDATGLGKQGFHLAGFELGEEAHQQRCADCSASPEVPAGAIASIRYIVCQWPVTGLSRVKHSCRSLLVTYQLFIRYTFIGNVLKGPRTRRQRTVRPAAPTGA